LKSEEVKELLDVSEYSNAEIMSEAERDIESLENGEDIKPNPAANTAYMQRFVDWLTDHQEDMDEETFQRFIAYMNSLPNIVVRNTVRQVQAHFIQALNSLPAGAPVPQDVTLGAVAQPTGAPATPSPAAPPAAPAAPAAPGAPVI
jgi:hypothetical protein